MKYFAAMALSRGLGEAVEDLLLAAGQVDGLSLVRRHRPQRLARLDEGLEAALEGRRLLPLPDDVHHGREGGMVGGDREQGNLQPLALLVGFDGELEALNGLLRPLAGLVGDRAVAIAVDVPVHVPAADDVVATLAEHAARRASEEVFALLVPEDDPVRRVDGKHRFAAAGDPVERFGAVGHGRRASRLQA
jgi:hypothetical protein